MEGGYAVQGYRKVISKQGDSHVPLVFFVVDGVKGAG